MRRNEKTSVEAHNEVVKMLDDFIERQAEKKEAEAKRVEQVEREKTVRKCMKRTKERIAEIGCNVRTRCR